MVIVWKSDAQNNFANRRVMPKTTLWTKERCAKCSHQCAKYFAYRFVTSIFLALVVAMNNIRDTTCVEMSRIINLTNIQEHHHPLALNTHPRTLFKHPIFIYVYSTHMPNKPHSSLLCSTIYAQYRSQAYIW